MLKFNAKDGNVIGTGHTASLTASSVRRNRSSSAAQQSPAAGSNPPEFVTYQWLVLIGGALAPMCRTHINRPARLYIDPATVIVATSKFERV
jgi:hypothetical protein